MHNNIPLNKDSKDSTQADEDSAGSPGKLQQGLLTYATLTSYTLDSSTAVFADAVSL